MSGNAAIDDHFAHKARLSPTGRRGNTDFHHEVRDELCEILKAHFPNGRWLTEVKLKSQDEDGNDFRADLAGFFGERSKDFPAVAIEVQCCPYSPFYIRKKNAAYSALGVHTLWVVPLTAELGDCSFRPRRYELYLHTLNMGYFFYYLPGSKGLLTPVHFGPSFRYIEYKSFFDSDANEVEAGDYYLKYKTLKKPVYTEAKTPLYELLPKFLKSWTNPNNARLNIPERKIMALRRGKWWPDDENKEWLKNNAWYYYVKKYLPHYKPDDENDELPTS